MLVGAEGHDAAATLSPPAGREPERAPAALAGCRGGGVRLRRRAGRRRGVAAGIFSGDPRWPARRARARWRGDRPLARARPRRSRSRSRTRSRGRLSARAPRAPRASARMPGGGWGSRARRGVASAGGSGDDGAPSGRVPDWGVVATAPLGTSPGWGSRSAGDAGTGSCRGGRGRGRGRRGERPFRGAASRRGLFAAWGRFREPENDHPGDRVHPGRNRAVVGCGLRVQSAVRRRLVTGASAAPRRSSALARRQALLFVEVFTTGTRHFFPPTSIFVRPRSAKYAHLD